MAGTVMHLVIADRLLEVLEIQNPALFYCGNLAPDAIMARKNYVREMKRHTHFKDGIRLHELHKPEKMVIYRDRLLAFYERFVKDASDVRHELFLGYLTHMLVDELYILHFRDDFVRELVQEGREPDDKEFFDRFARDVDLMDWELVRNYRFHYAMPDILRTENAYEIPGFITNEELLDSKEYIISKNFLTCHEPEKMQVMTFRKNMDFIDLCVEKIPKILKEHFS